MIGDRVLETTTSLGTGAITLRGAMPQCRTFASVYVDGQIIPYTLVSSDGYHWETGRGVLSGNTLERTDIITSTNSNLPIDLVAGTHTVYSTLTHYDLSVMPFTRQSIVRSIENTPPVNAQMGEAFIVGDLPTGGFVNQQGKLAIRFADKYRFVQPYDGMAVNVVSPPLNLRYNPTSGKWEERRDIYITAAHTTTALSLQDHFAEFKTLKFYDGKCTGTDDDSDSLLKALESIGETGGGILYCRGPVFFTKKISIAHPNVTLAMEKVILGPDARLRISGSLNEYSRKPSGDSIQLSADSSTDVDGRMVLTLKPGEGAFLQVGDRILVRGENDAFGNTLEKQNTYIYSITGDTVVCTDAPAFTFQPTYPDSDYPLDLTEGTKVYLIAYSEFAVDPVRGNTSVVVQDASIFAVDDTVLLSDARVERDLNPTANYKNPSQMEYCKIIRIDYATNTLMLDTPLSRNYLSGTFHGGVAKTDLVKNSHVTIRDMTFSAPHVNKTKCVEMSYTEGCSVSVSNLAGKNLRKGDGIRFSYSFRSWVYDSWVDGAGFYESGQGYGYACYSSTDCIVRDSGATSCRHNYLQQAGTRCGVNNFVSRDDIISGIDIHGANCVDYVIINPNIARTTLARSDVAGVTTSGGIRIGNSSHTIGDFNGTIQGGKIGPYAGGAAISFAPSSGGLVVQGTHIADAAQGFEFYKNSSSVTPTQTANDVLLQGVVFERCGAPLSVQAGVKGRLNKLRVYDCVSKQNSQHFKVAGDAAGFLSNVDMRRNKIVDPVANPGGYAYDVEECDNLILIGNDALGANRGVRLKNCPNAKVLRNTLEHTVEAVPFTDEGGNTNLDYRGNELDQPRLRKIASTIADSVTTTAVVLHDQLTPLVANGFEAAAGSVSFRKVGSQVKVTAVIPYLSMDTNSATGAITAHLFVGETAIASLTKRVTTGGSSGEGLTLVGYYEAVSTAPVDIKLMVGSSVSTNTITLNAKFNGNSRPFLLIEEFN